MREGRNQTGAHRAKQKGQRQIQRPENSGANKCKAECYSPLCQKRQCVGLRGHGTFSSVIDSLCIQLYTAGCNKTSEPNVTLQDDPLQPGPQGYSAYQRLLDDIREGNLLPGERLREIELSERLGVSRTPVREAIRQLEADGLVTHVPRQGATVRSLDYAEVMELYEMRAVLEGTAARLAARAASGVELDELEVLNDRLAEAGTGPDAVRINRIFHATLLDAAKNRFLAKSMLSLQKALLVLGPSQLLDGDRAEAAVAEHRRIMAALNARDGAAAETEMRAHIQAAQRMRIRALQERDRRRDETQ